jgi:hypothetical protein
MERGFEANFRPPSQTGELLVIKQVGLLKNPLRKKLFL